MSQLPTEEEPQCCAKQEEPEQKKEQADPAEEEVSLAGPEEEKKKEMEEEEEEDKKIQDKIQSVFQQVRNQIRSQVDTRTPSSSILELIQKMKLREGRPEQEDDDKETEAEEGKAKADATQEELPEAFGKKLEATEKTLRCEIEALISQVRAESRAYTQQAVKDLECRMLRKQVPLQPRQEKKGPEKRQQPPAAPSLASRRGRVLTRTVTTIIPKTCVPVVHSPQAKPESASFRRSEASGLLRPDPVLALPGRRLLHQGRRPILPPAHPTQHSSLRNRLAKCSTGH